jgi:hypothetical protein
MTLTIARSLNAMHLVAAKIAPIPEIASRKKGGACGEANRSNFIAKPTSISFDKQIDPGKSCLTVYSNWPNILDLLPLCRDCDLC